MAMAKEQACGFKTVVHQPKGDITMTTSIIYTVYVYALPQRGQRSGLAAEAGQDPASRSKMSFDPFRSKPQSYCASI